MWRVNCSECGVTTETLDWLAAVPSYTQRFALFVGSRCHESSVSDVASELGLDWHTTKDLYKLYMEQQLLKAGPPSPIILGIDEIAVGKNHKYRIVVSDLQARRPIWFGGIDRSEASLDLFYRWLGPEKCRAIRIVVMDMWRAFRSSTRKSENAPQAKIIYDKFHILQHLSKAIDQTRKDEYKTLADKDRGYIKGQKYTLLSRWANLDKEGRQALNELFKVNVRLCKAYLLKESFDQLWDYSSETWARKFFEKWTESLKWQRLPRLVKFATMVEDHWEGIANYCGRAESVSLGFVEGLNNKIRAIQRMAYGFRDEDYFRLKILTCMLQKL
jgi:transposase